MSTVTAGVFQDLEWAKRGVLALVADGFDPAVLTLLARDSPGAALLIESTLHHIPDRVDLTKLGPVLVHGPLIAVLQGADGALTQSGLAATIWRAGFQAHDGYIFETLVAKGGVLTAVSHDSRAADALARLHAYGGANAAIGAWTGRV